MKTPEEFVKKAVALLGHNPEAIDFIKLHNEFVHAADDVVDEHDLPRMTKCRSFLLAWKYYNHPYFLKNADKGLRMVSLLNHIDYENSVKWEISGDPEQLKAASILRHTSISILFAVLIIECGVDVANEVASDFREHTLEAHKDDKEFKVVV